MFPAVGWRSPEIAEEESYAASGAVKDRERWAKMGESRSSSSKRGSARAVSCQRVSKSWSWHISE
jgi:hypothetical protein